MAPPSPASITGTACLHIRNMLLRFTASVRPARVNHGGAVGSHADIGGGHLTLATCVEQVLQVDDVVAAVGRALVGHTVVADQGDDRAQLLEPRTALVQRRVVGQRLGMVGRVLELDVVCQRQVQQRRREILLEQSDPGIEHEQRQIRGVHVRQRPSDQIQTVVDTVFLPHYTGLPAEMAEMRSRRCRHRDPSPCSAVCPLVLRSDHRHPGASFRDHSEDGARAQQIRPGHDYRLASHQAFSPAGWAKPNPN